MHAFKAATMLYAILSLPEDLSRAFWEPGSSNSRQHVLKSHRETLLDAIEGSDKHLRGMGWPLAVLGVALHGGGPADQAVAIKFIKAIAALPDSSCGPVTLQRRLTDFWAGDKSGWDDCFWKQSQILY